jgi:uncharacterized membrane protein YgcG
MAQWAQWLLGGAAALVVLAGVVWLALYPALQPRIRPSGAARHRGGSGHTTWNDTNSSSNFTGEGGGGSSGG